MTAEIFLQELQKIIASHPNRPLKIINSENCEYGDQLYFAKNIIFGFDCTKVSDCTYIYDSSLSDKCMDCEYAVESQLSYDSVDLYKAYNCDFSNYCTNIRDSAFCHWCENSNDLFGCVYLKNKSFCIFNRQLTEEKYHEEVKKYKTWPKEKVLAIVEELKARFPLTQTIGVHNENSTYGNYMHYCKNCYLSFDAAFDNDCAYLYDSFYCNNCFDMVCTGQESSLSYEIISSGNIFNSNYVSWSASIEDSSYIFDCFDVKNSLGCVNIAHKQYCLLNRQLTKEGYEKIVPQLLNELKTKNLGWGNITLEI